ncbi:MAG: hypothetical protein IT176_10230 [Acidobacteria bacterium]|nr:hypothetical protein [Acidobacteriota bacterium]
MRGRSWLAAACLAALAAAPAAASASQSAPQAPAAGEGIAAADIAPAELQRMFDAYALLQAQQLLEISDESYPRFLMRFKALQDARRRATGERTRRTAELQRLAADAASPDADIKTRLDELRAFETRTADEMRAAYAQIDQVLDVRQQARFRAFEVLMERRKLDLVSRARQSARPAVRAARPRQPRG